MIHIRSETPAVYGKYVLRMTQDTQIFIVMKRKQSVAIKKTKKHEKVKYFNVFRWLQVIKSEKSVK